MGEDLDRRLALHARTQTTAAEPGMAAARQSNVGQRLARRHRTEARPALAASPRHADHRDGPGRVRFSPGRRQAPADPARRTQASVIAACGVALTAESQRLRPAVRDAASGWLFLTRNLIDKCSRF